MNELIERLAAQDLINGEMIILEKYAGDACQMVEIETFAGFFGSVLDDAAQVDKYEALKAADQGKGYTPFFDRWHELGII